MMPVTGDISSIEELDDFWAWIKTFERNGIDPLKEIVLGF